MTATPRVPAAALVLTVLSLAGIAIAWWGVRAELQRPRDLHTTAFGGSGECQRCHPQHYESWHRTFHRTMTRDADPDAVLGRFDGSEVDYFGWTARLTRDGDALWASFAAPNGTVERHRIVRTVGSRRIQQYLAEIDDVLWRLPVAWHVEEDRWIHMNGAFLTPDPIADPIGADASQADFARHVTRWNDNCIFCHNVGPNPGWSGEAFESEVAELGVACESCHGPASEHAQRNANPLRRYMLHAGNEDPTIVNPSRLSPERSAQVCGRCHGQRKSDAIERFMAEGDPFVPGDDLAATSEPLWRDTTLGAERPFGARFWLDGTPRLTAYEYQGWLQSPCTQRGTMTCTDCHAMHEGDPRGQLRPEAEGDGACLQCHEVGDEAANHTHRQHDPTLAGLDEVGCVDCHMPRIVYGLIGAHRSHRIETPGDASGRPDACTLCHVDRPRGWPETKDGESSTFAMLFEGDPIERAVAADALGRSELGDAETVRGWLLEAMAGDPYPAVRRIAFRALRRRTDPPPPFTAFRPATPAPERSLRVEALRAEVPHRAPHAERVDELRQRAAAVAIEIGE